jgi:hypothetical protein
LQTGHRKKKRPYQGKMIHRNTPRWQHQISKNEFPLKKKKDAREKLLVYDELAVETVVTVAMWSLMTEAITTENVT